jgi:predicted transglutaminase-like cysteine proteinase
VTDAPPALDGVALIPRHPPLAHTLFCHRYAGQCDVAPDRRRPGMTEAEMLAEARRINRRVNRAITPRDDPPGQDRWDIHVPAGDCEDYALTKRADLLALGWPSSDVIVAVVQLRDRRFHAVLVVRIGGTDWVLDNLRPEVVPIERTRGRYRLHWVQTRGNPRVWLQAG